MYLKRLELYGYKSFASRTILEFERGITAIVGPNGCGKSNIADAVRWVMGEQSYTTLRARRTEDMIFAGTSRRSRLGMAQVLLTLDNSEGQLPVDFAEVTIGRRAYRSGENEYVFNGSRVRHRDIIDFLGTAGLARAMYTVIGQGLVDAALSLRPEARRALFEEAAGIAPHLRKRGDAIRRIDETQRNLQRIQDILSELLPRAETLKRQAERAEEYTLLQQDLQELQRIWYGYHWQQAQVDLERANQKLREHQVRLGEYQSRLQGLDGQQQAEQGKRLAQEQEIARLEAERADLRDQLGRLNQELAIAKEQEKLLHEQFERLRNDIKALLSRKKVLEQGVVRAEEECAAVERDLANEQQALEELRTRVASIERQRCELEKEQGRLESLWNGMVSERSRNEAQLEQLEQHRRNLMRDREALSTRLEQLTQRIDEVDARIQELEEHLAQIQATRSEWEKEIVSWAERIELDQAALAEMEEERSRFRARRRELLSRREALDRMRRELVGYYPGVRQVLRARQQLGGILGTVAGLMTVPVEFERAIEAALGARLQYVVTERWADAERAIELLKSQRAGWATFLPLDTIRAPDELRIRGQGDIVGVASRLVKHDERLQRVYQLLLGRVLVVRTLAVARRLLSRTTGASLIVTLDGETVQPTGAVSGGTRQRQPRLLAQEREWRRLPGQIREVEAELASLEQRYAEQTTRIAKAQEMRTSLQKQLVMLDEEERQLREALSSRKQDFADATRDRQWNLSRLEQIKEELAQLESNASSLRERQQALADKQTELGRKLEDLRQRLAGVIQDDPTRRLAELEARVAVGERTLQSQRRLLASHQESLRALLQELGARQSQQSELEERTCALARKREELTRTLERLAEEDEGLANRLTERRKAFADQLRVLRDLEHSRAQLLDQLQEVESAYHLAALERDRVQERLAALEREARSNLGQVELPHPDVEQLQLSLGADVVKLPRVPVLPKGLGGEIRELKARISRLGPINPEAPQEYAALVERQNFLQRQAQDLREAIAKLQQVIRELDDLIEADFSRTVHTVDQAFRRNFRRLFDGGSARLVLTDPEDMSATGVDIIAHPPGKRAQRLSLLSGGERALTAVALIFALLEANPVPFCFLDEVDAALDEANVGRFRDMLLEYAQKTQFVIITHNRRTMEAASAIYGISMSERGVSQCVSLKLDPLVTEAALQR